MTHAATRARWLGAMTLAMLVSACGGGGGTAPTASPTELPQTSAQTTEQALARRLVASEFNQPTGHGTSQAARYGDIDVAAFSEHADTLQPAVSSGGGLITLTAAVPAGNAWGGVLAVVYPAATTHTLTHLGYVAPQDYSNQSEMHIAVGSTDVQRILIELEPEGAPYKTCYRAVELTVDATAREYVVPLTEEAWSSYAYCPGAPGSVSLAEALAHVNRINVGFTQNQVPGIADGVARHVTVGKIFFAGRSPAPIDYNQQVAVYNRPIGNGDSLSALYGGFGYGLFAEQNNAFAPIDAAHSMVSAKVSVPVGNTYGGLLLEAFGPGSTWTPSRANSAQGVGDIVYGDFRRAKTLRVQIGSLSASHAVVRLFPHAGPYDSCVPTFLLPIDGTFRSRDIDLHDAGWFVPDYCTTAQRARTVRSTLADLKSVAVGLTERGTPEILDGTARDFTLGEIDFAR